MATRVDSTVSFCRKHVVVKGRFKTNVVTYNDEMSMGQVWENKPSGRLVYQTSMFSGPQHAEFANSLAIWALYDDDIVPYPRALSFLRKK